MMDGLLLLTNLKSWRKMDAVALVRRDDFYDILINNKKVGSGFWRWVDTAYYFYRLEGMEVKIYE